MSIYQDEGLIVEQPKTLVTDHLRNIEQRRVVNDGSINEEWSPCLWYAKLTGERIPLAAKTELVIIAGEKKARKSLLLSVIIGSRIPDLDRSNTLGFELDMEQPVLYFDTEQPRRRVKKNRVRYHEMIKYGAKDDSDFIQYSLRGLSPHVMKDTITHVIQKMIDDGRPPGMIVIDQIADLSATRDENDKAASVDIIDMLNAWTEMTGALMMATIHVNRGGQQTNGRLGSLLDQKTDCTFRLNLEEDTWITTVSHVYSRERRMPIIKFNQTYSGLSNFISEAQETKSYF